MTKLLIINAVANHIFIGECKLKPWRKVSMCARGNKSRSRTVGSFKKNTKPTKKPIRENKIFL